MGQNIYNYNKYGDNLVRKKRRRFFLKLSIIFGGFVTLSGILIYFLFFSNLLQITEQNIEGLKTLKNEDIYSVTYPIINQIALGIAALKPQRNIFFFSNEFTVGKILADFPVVEKVEIKKKYPHKLIVSIKEREPIGVWCFDSLAGGECRYFDKYGIFWGQALKSSGPLFLNVEDERILEFYPKTVETQFKEAFNLISLSFDKISVAIRKIQIPNDSINDFHVYTPKGYYVTFSAVSEISKQIESLEIFLADKKEGFAVEYLDARIPGRIYYK